MSRRPVSTSLLAASAVYALSMGVLWMRQTQLLYRAPRKVFCDDTPETLLDRTDTDPAMRGWVDGPRDTSECVIYFGGSSESVELRRPNLASPCGNMTRYFMPYRGFGPNHGMKISESALKADALRLFDAAAARHDRVHVVSRSLGTGVGLAVAARRPVDRLALITPYDSIAAVAGEKYHLVPTNRILRDRFESWRDAGQVKTTSLVCLAGLDKVISPRRWAELKRHFTVAPIESLFQQCDHSNIADCHDMWSQIGSFIAARPSLQLAPEASVPLPAAPARRMRMR
jgi:pimeloyl-ACP methyl ester carboxylesterase